MKKYPMVDMSLVVRRLWLVLVALTASIAAQGQPVRDIPYKIGATLTEYESERCKLDLYPPTNRPYDCLVWLHGGGLTGGGKHDRDTIRLAQTLADEGIGVVLVNYRLGPKAKYPDYVDDAATAFAWAKAHIAEYGGDARRVFLGGHSAGAYLTSLVGMDSRYLEKNGLKSDAIAGLIPVSGQMMTHFLVRQERGLGTNTIVADEAAPIYYTRSNTPPMLILMGGKDWPARLEENQYFAATQRTAGNTVVTIRVFPDRNHGSIVSQIPDSDDPVRKAIVDFIRSPR